MQAVSENFLIVVVDEGKVDKKAGPLCACFFYNLQINPCDGWKFKKGDF